MDFGHWNLFAIWCLLFVILIAGKIWIIENHKNHVAEQLIRLSMKRYHGYIIKLRGVTDVIEYILFN